MRNSEVTTTLINDLYIVEHQDGFHVRSDPRGIALAADSLARLKVEIELDMLFVEEEGNDHFVVKDLSFDAQGTMFKIVTRSLSQLIPNTIIYRLDNWDFEKGPQFSKHPRIADAPIGKYTNTLRATNYVDFETTWVFGHPNVLKRLVTSFSENQVACSYGVRKEKPTAIRLDNSELEGAKQAAALKNFPLWIAEYSGE